MIQGGPHIQDHIQVVMRRRWVILTFFTVLVVTVLLGSLKQVPIYQATTIVRIEHESPRVVSVQEVAPMGPTGDYRAYKDYYETQYKLITSHTLLKKVADSLNLKSHGPYRRKDPLYELLKFVTVSPIKNSQLVEISAEDPDPKMAAMIANTVANMYIRQNLERNVNTATNAAEWLSERIDEQGQKLKDAELALQKYRKENNINTLPQMTGDEAIEQIKAEYARLQALLANYAERYTYEHPKMIELKAQINSLRNKIHGLEDIDTGNKTMEYRVLEREFKTNKHMYQVLLSRLKEINVSSTLNVNNISIIDFAEVPIRPIKPNMKLNMALAIMVGLVMGTGLGFFVDYLDRTVKSPYDVKETLKSRFLGSVPEMEEEDESKKDKVVHLQPKSPISEVYRQVRTEILGSMPKESGSKCILMTSAESQAGKTMTSANISIALSQTGSKVLLVDGDLRKPQVHKVFNLNRNSGLGEYLAGDAALDSIAKDTEVENLKVITSGKTPQNPAEIIGSSRMKEFIRDVKKKFDFVVFDTPPIASVTDAVILANMVDASIQVVRSGKVLVPVALNAKEKLINTGANFLGVILNDLKSHHGDYYYYYKYYKYYGEGGKRRSVKKETPLKNKLIELFENIKQKLKELLENIKQKR